MQPEQMSHHEGSGAGYCKVGSTVPEATTVVAHVAHSQALN